MIVNVIKSKAHRLAEFIKNGNSHVFQVLRTGNQLLEVLYFIDWLESVVSTQKRSSTSKMSNTGKDRESINQY